MSRFISLNIDQTVFQLFGDKYVYMPEHQSLILADIHIGKVHHFRKNGIQVPQNLASDNLKRLHSILTRHKPKEVLILGDLFHSKHNSEWENFKALRFHFSITKFILLLGNHDTFLDEEYNKTNIQVIHEPFKIGNKVFSHEPFKNLQVDQVNFHGHIHPAATLKGSALQSLRLPCFHYSRQHFVLPAFGSFTGTHRIKPKAKDRVFVCAEGKVYEVYKKDKVKGTA